MAFDPLSMVEHHHEALAGMKLCFVDCGGQDQYHIHYGTRRFVARLDALSVPHRYEEFVGTHSGIDHRLDVSFSSSFKSTAKMKQENQAVSS